MKRFRCECGQRIFFENLQCTHCTRRLGFDPCSLSLSTLETGEGPEYVDASGRRYRFCRNHDDYGVCNWLIRAASSDVLCLSCRRNLVIPDLSDERRITLWGRLESAKRRLLYTLLSRGLPVDGLNGTPVMTFRFLEDQRTNPLVANEFVETGHVDGTITINVAEADDSVRHAVREGMQERYRTLLGHFRHESGHYYFEAATGDRERFRALFGDERADYQAALARYYESPPVESSWSTNFISQYASAHPLEDWAESWAHYLHVVDTLESAKACGIIETAVAPGEEGWLDAWIDLSVTMNELNRSMGGDDAYPFVLSSSVAQKLEFIHRRVERMAAPKAAPAGR